MCETLKSWKFCTANEGSDGLPYLLAPTLETVVDSRTDVGKLLGALSAASRVQLNWLFQLSNEKYRVTCKVRIALPGQSEASDSRILELWRMHSDDQ